MLLYPWLIFILSFFVYNSICNIYLFCLLLFQFRLTIYIDIYNYILTYHTINDKIDVTTTSLLDIEKQLIKYGFFKINRSTIVNLKYIKSVKDTLVDVNGNILTLSRRRKKEFMEKLTEYFGESNI